MAEAQAASTSCPHCSHEVPSLPFCVRCGVDLAAGGASRGGAFAGAPDEPASGLRVISTLFPQLPRADMAAFRIALVAGTVIVASLAATGFYPVALLAAAVLVPLIYVIYVYDVDVYEDEPIRVIAATMAWGALVGVAAGLLLRALEPSVSRAGRTDPATIGVFGVLVPLVELAAILVGPLFLLRYRRFDDVLDGVTFGAASAVSFGGAVVIAGSIDILTSGLRPAGDPLPWLVTVLGIAVVLPTLQASAVAGVAAAAWFRYRAAHGDPAALGILGRPVVAALLAGAMFVIVRLARMLLDPIPALAVGLVLAAFGLLWVRRAIHLGLLQEASEIAIGPPFTCANCGRSTPAHTFCGHCGIALAALPKHGPGAVAPVAPAAPPAAGEPPR